MKREPLTIAAHFAAAFCLFAGPLAANFSLDELELAIERDPTNKPLLMEIVRRYHRTLVRDVGKRAWFSQETKRDKKDQPQIPRDHHGPLDKEAAAKTWKKALRHFDLLSEVFRLHRLRDGDRVDALALAYHSSFNVLRAGELGKRGSKMDRLYMGPVMLGQAVRDLDLAASLDPTNMEIRVIRGLNGYAHPEKSRYIDARDDLYYVIQVCERDPRKGTGIDLPELYLVCGKCLARVNDFINATKMWTALVGKYSLSDHAEEAKGLIAEYDFRTRRQQYVIDQRRLKEQQPD